MKNEFRAAASFVTCIEIANIGVDKTEIFPSRFTDDRTNVLQIVLVTGGEIIEADDALIEAKQLFHEM